MLLIPVQGLGFMFATGLGVSSNQAKVSRNCDVVSRL